MEPVKILVIEDDLIVARTIERSLRGEQYQVVLATSGAAGLNAARQAIPDLVILDVVMPGMDGYAVCRTMRADPQLANVPILFLTARVKDDDRLAGFKAGADDYLCKPFNLDELFLRIQAILRRTLHRSQAFPHGQPPQAEEPAAPRSRPHPAPGRQPARHLVAVGSFILDTRSYELVTPHNGRVRLTPVQFDLLYHLMTHPGEIFSPARLLDEVWDYPTDRGSPDLVRVHIRTLRERIEADPRAPTFIRTIPGFGYTVQSANA